ncbi:MAG: ABC transporter ATP-binding protein [Anaerolineales bacterium]
MPSNLAIQTEHLRKEFGRTVAVQGLTLEVPRGEVFGFLGPNGAGKTTSIKMLLSLVAPTSGEARLLGRPISDRRIRRQVGFLPEHFRFHDWLTAEEFLALHGRLFGMDEDELQRRIPDLLDLVGLLPFRRAQLRTFSKGMLQRVGLAQAIIHGPDLVILDEPTSGLDPVGRRLVRDIIQDLRRRGTTVFLNSHFLSEIEITCDRVAFIKRGEVVQTSNLDELMEAETVVQIRGRGLSEEVVAGLRRWGQDVARSDGEVRVRMTDPDAVAEMTRFLVAQGVDVLALTPIHPTLEDVFVRIVGSEAGL